MKRQNQFENAKPDDDFVIEVLKDSQYPIAVDPDRLAANVLDRIRNRRRGFQRLIGSVAALFALVAISVLAIQLRSDQQHNRLASIELEDSIVNESDNRRADAATFIDDQIDFRESAQKLLRLREELAALNRIEHEQHLALARERVSRSLANTTNPYPVFIGD